MRQSAVRGAETDVVELRVCVRARCEGRRLTSLRVTCVRQSTV